MKSIMQSRLWRYVFLSCMVMAITFVPLYVAGFQHVLEWNKSLRSAVTGILLLSVAQAAIRVPLTKGIWRVAFISYGASLLIYGGVLALDGGERASYDSVYPYYMGALCITIGIAFLLRLAAGRGTALSHLCAAMTAIGQTLLIVSAAVYLGYFLLFGDVLRMMNMVPILLTHTAEAVGFALDRAGIPGTLLALLFPVLLFALLYRLARGQMHGTRLTGSVRVGVVCLLLAVSGWQAGKYGMASFPYEQVYGASAYIQTMRQSSLNHEKNLALFHLTGEAEQLLSRRLPGTVLFIIGESETRDRMKAFSPAYGADNTPWLSSMKDTPGFYLMRQAYSNYPVTVPALSMALYGRNQYDHRRVEDAIHIVDVARAAGYKTYWFSNQEKMGVIDFVSYSADREKRTGDTGGPDGQLLDALKTVPEGENNFIIIHLMGSHVRYDDRLPTGYPLLATDGHDHRTNVYDTTVKYTDEVLREIYEYAKAHLHLRSMIYFSDHGENMERSHVDSKHMTYDMVRIPLFIYLSPDYRRVYPETASALSANQGKVWTNDLAFDMVSGILHASNTQYDSRWDITGISYGLTRDEARTKHGAWRIADDPDYHGSP